MTEAATYQGVELIRQTELEVRTIERERSGTSWTRNEKYEKDGYYVVRDLYNPEELYHPLPRERGLLRYRGRDVSLYDYEGGNVQLLDEAGESYIVPRQKGCIVLFDSRTQHRVNRVTKGVRKSIVGWTVGPRWK